MPELSHELKILTYTGCHNSIFHPLGMSEIQDEPVSIITHVSTTDLDSYRRWIELDQTKWIIKNLSSALQFLQSKRVLMNILTEKAILMKDPESFWSLPVIVDFSYACLAECATHFIKHHKKLFSTTSHLPVDVSRFHRDSDYPPTNRIFIASLT